MGQLWKRLAGLDSQESNGLVWMRSRTGEVKRMGGLRDKAAASTLLTWKVLKCPSYCLPSWAKVRIGFASLRPATTVFVTVILSPPHILILKVDFSLLPAAEQSSDYKEREE